MSKHKKKRVKGKPKVVKLVGFAQIPTLVRVHKGTYVQYSGHWIHEPASWVW